MRLDELKRFCSTDRLSRNLHHPWIEGEWSFATDGRIIVMVPKIDGAVAPKDIFPPNGSQFLPNDDVYDWVPLSKCERGAKITCHYCRVDCDVCHGDGFVGNDDCDKCGAGGWVTAPEPCDECGDTRKIAGYQCGVALIDPWLIRNLPLESAEFVPATKKRTGVLFRFDDGYAVAMPIYVED